MSDLIAIVAGGIYEVKNYLKHEMKHSLNYATILGALSSIFLFGAAAIVFDNYQSDSKEEELVEKITKHATMVGRMPTRKAEELGTHCVYCYSNPSNIVLIPCNHLCLCSECFKKMKEMTG